MNRRAHPRYNLRLPVTVLATPRGERVRSFTRDISASGAYLVPNCAPAGEAELKMVLHFSCLLGLGSDMTAQARVVRRDPGGVAVAFARIDASREMVS